MSFENESKREGCDIIYYFQFKGIHHCLTFSLFDSISRSIGSDEKQEIQCVFDVFSPLRCLLKTNQREKGCDIIYYFEFKGNERRGRRDCLRREPFGSLLELKRENVKHQ